MRNPARPPHGIDLAARFKLGQPLHLHAGIQPRRLLPVPGKITDDARNAFLQQFAQLDPLDRQPVHRPPGFERELQQPGWPGRAITHLSAEQFGQPQPAPDRIGSGRNVAARAERIEQRPKRLIKIEITHRDHAGKQHAPAR